MGPVTRVKLDSHRVLDVTGAIATRRLIQLSRKRFFHSLCPVFPVCVVSKIVLIISWPMREASGNLGAK